MALFGWTFICELKCPFGDSLGPKFEAPGVMADDC